MWPYWLLFIFPAFLALQESGRKDLKQKPIALISGMTSGWWFFYLFLTFMIGWRHQVGGDWQQYLYLLDLAKYESTNSKWWSDDPGFRFLEWICSYYDWSIYTLNLISASIFSFGLVAFCRNLPRPWLGVSVAVPYLVIILGMGYTRQGIALGFIMIALAFLERGLVRKFIIFAVVGALFHKSAVLVLPLAVLSATRNRFLVLIGLSLVGYSSYVFLLQDSVELLQKNYLEAEYQSEGTLIRLLMNIVPATFVLWKRKNFMELLPKGKLWGWFAIISYVLLGAYAISPSSTAVDRIALYVLPLQVMAFSYAPMVLGGNIQQGIFVSLVLLYYGMVEFVWLNYAATAFAWIPYRFYLFE